MSTLIENVPLDTNVTDFAPGTNVIPLPVAAKQSRLPRGKITVGAAIMLLVAAGASTYFYHAAGFETTDDAYLEGHVHQVSPRINGTVARVLVDDNARVKIGQPLLEIDPADLGLAVQGAEADLAQAHANVEQIAAQAARARADVAAVTARIAQNSAESKRAQLDFRRAEILAAGDAAAISAQQLDAARAAADASQAAGEALVAQRTSAEAALTAVLAQQSVVSAQVQKAAATLDTAKLQTDYTVVRAPVSGRTGRKNVEAGQRLQPGQPVMAIVDDDVWVVANFKESQLAHLRAGQKVSVRVDAVDGRTFSGVVQSFSPGTGARFSLLPPDNSTGNFTKVVQRVPVKIVLSADSAGADADRLFPGLSAVVSVDIRN
jgi:membrane fusion protein, multidrug efflux system